MPFYCLLTHKNTHFIALNNTASEIFILKLSEK